jgi:hypothetical protein
MTISFKNALPENAVVIFPFIPKVASKLPFVFRRYRTKSPEILPNPVPATNILPLLNDFTETGLILAILTMPFAPKFASKVPFVLPNR